MTRLPLPVAINVLPLSRRRAPKTVASGARVKFLDFRFGLGNPEQAAPMLVQLIGESSERKRSDAAWLWGYAAKALPPEPLLKLLTDPVPGVRRAAVGSLSSFKNREDVFAGLIRVLDDPDESVRCSAASALGYYGDQRAVPLLRKMLPNASETIQRIVEYALQQLAKAR